MPSSAPSSRVSYDLRFVDFSFNEREIINDWIEKRKLEVSDTVLGIVDANWKFSSSIDGRDGLYNVTLTPKNLPKSRKSAPVYMFKHSDLFKLLGIVAYFWTERLASGDTLDVDLGHDFDW